MDIKYEPLPGRPMTENLSEILAKSKKTDISTPQIESIPLL